jgi:hypothetical protein
MGQLPARFRRAQHHDQDVAASRSTVLRGAVTLVLVVLVIALGALNVATLLSDRIHARAYEVVSGVVQALCGDSCLEDSPTEVRKREVQAAVVEARAEILALEATTLALVAATTALVSSHTVLKAAHAKVRQVAGVISRRMAGRLVRGATRKAATLPGQALPILGATVSVGLAGLEIHDACEAIKDLNSLQQAIGEGIGDEEGIVCGIRIPSVDDLKQLLSDGWSQAYQSAAVVINADGGKVPPTAVRPSEGQAKSIFCRVFGC